MTKPLKKLRINAEDKAIGTRLRTRREECGLDLGALGSALGVSSQQVQEMEFGSRSISARHLWRASGVLRRDLDYFFVDLEG